MSPALIYSRYINNNPTPSLSRHASPQSQNGSPFIISLFSLIFLLSSHPAVCPSFSLTPFLFILLSPVHSFPSSCSSLRPPLFHQHFLVPNKFYLFLVSNFLFSDWLNCPCREEVVCSALLRVYVRMWLCVCGKKTLDKWAANKTDSRAVQTCR